MSFPGEVRIFRQIRTSGKLIGVKGMLFTGTKNIAEVF